MRRWERIARNLLLREAPESRWGDIRCVMPVKTAPERGEEGLVLGTSIRGRHRQRLDCPQGLKAHGFVLCLLVVTAPFGCTRAADLCITLLGAICAVLL